MCCDYSEDGDKLVFVKWPVRPERTCHKCYFFGRQCNESCNESGFYEAAYKAKKELDLEQLPNNVLFNLASRLDKGNYMLINGIVYEILSFPSDTKWYDCDVYIYGAPAKIAPKHRIIFYDDEDKTVNPGETVWFIDNRNMATIHTEKENVSDKEIKIKTTYTIEVNDEVKFKKETINKIPFDVVISKLKELLK